MVYLYLVSMIALEVFRRLLNLADAGDICCFSFASIVCLCRLFQLGTWIPSWRHHASIFAVTAAVPDQ